MELNFFLVFALMAAISGILVLLQRNPVYSALFLLAQLLCLVVIYALLQAYLVAMVQLLVYAGAIIVLFLFALMILNPEEDKGWFASLNLLKLVLITVGALSLLGGLLFFIKSGNLPAASDAANPTDNAKAVGRMIFSDYLFPFEIVSILLLVAVMGVTVLAKKENDPEETAEKEEQP